LHGIENVPGDGEEFFVIEGFEVGAAYVPILAEAVAVKIDGCAGRYQLVFTVLIFTSQVAEGEEKVCDDGGDGRMVAGGVGPGGVIDFIGDTDGEVSHETAPLKQRSGVRDQKSKGPNPSGFGPSFLLIMSVTQMGLILCKLFEELRRYERTMDQSNELAIEQNRSIQSMCKMR
jgi:hypothetical protein